MDYQITGVIKEIFPLIGGVNDKGEWKKRQVLVENTNGQGYKTELILFFWNDKVELLNSLGIGEERTFHFNLKSRKSKENYYTEASVWRITQ